METAQRCRIRLSLFALAFLTIAGCAESAGTGASVTIPIVDIDCRTSRCRAAVSGRAYIVYTTSGCTNPSFGETVAGSATLSCNGVNCTASIISFTNQAGSSATTFREGFYSVCVVVDFNSNYIGAAVAGQDTTGALSDSLMTNGTATKTVTVFTDI